MAAESPGQVGPSAPWWAYPADLATMIRKPDIPGNLGSSACGIQPGNAPGLSHFIESINQSIDPLSRTCKEFCAHPLR